MKIFTAILSIFITITLYGQDKKSVVIGVQDFADYMPYSSYADGKFGGFERELLDLFASSYGYTITYKALPVKRLYQDFLKGSVDAKFPDNEYWSGDMKQGKKILYSTPVLYYIDGVIVHKDSQAKGIGALKKLGIVLGFTPFAYLNEIKKGTITQIENVSIDSLINQIAAGHVDGGYMNISVGNYYINKKKLTGTLIFDKTLPHTRSTRHLSSLNNPGLITDFNSFLIREKVKVDALKMKYAVESGVE